MSIEQFREAVLSEAREAAMRVTDEAQSAADALLADCEREVRSIVDGAIAAGEEAASRELAIRERLARRRAREQVQGAMRDAYDHLRTRAVEKAEASRGTDEYRDLIGRLRDFAHGQIGRDITVIEDPDGAGGLLAEADGRRVSYTLAELIDRALQQSGGDVERLWA